MYLYLGGNIMNKDGNFGLLNREKMIKIQAEVQFIRKNYGLNNLTLNSLAKYANSISIYKDGNLTKIASTIKHILLCYGYSDEEITQFMNKNKIMFDSNYADFRFRLALMHRFGIFEYVFFNHLHILTNDFTKYFFGTRDIYSIMHSNEKLGIINNEENIINIKSQDLIAIRNNFPFDMEQIKKYDADFLTFLKAKKAENIREKGL